LHPCKHVIWLAQSLAADWRWLPNREDSPWYPKLHIFRQKVLGDWDEVLQRMAVEIERLVLEARSDRR
jgi:hypothetical protein